MENWKIPKLLENGTAYILGGGASIISQFGIPSRLVREVREGKRSMRTYSQYFECIHDKFVIGVNAAFNLGNWLNAIYFLDKTFMLTWRGAMAASRIPAYSALPYTEDERWCVTLNSEARRGISNVPHTVCHNSNSGAAAINLAYHMGATTIVLIGFDMKNVNNKQHFHGEYINSKLERIAEHKMDYEGHIEVFGAIKKDADKLGIKIINTSLKSRLRQFEKIPLKEILDA